MPEGGRRTRWVLEAALRRPAFVLGPVAVALVGSLAASWLAPRRYRSQSRVLAHWADQADLGQSGIAAELAERRLRAVTQRVVAGAAVERERLGAPSAAVRVEPAGDGSFAVETEHSDPSKAALLSNRLAHRLVEEAERERLQAGETEALAARAADARRAMEDVEAAIVRFRKSAAPASQAVSTLERLAREYDEARRVYLDAEERLTAARTTEGGRVAFTVVRAASPPSTPQTRSPALLAVLGALVGLAAGFGLAVLADLRDQTIKGPEDLGKVLGRPVLVEIPLVQLPRPARHRPPRR